MPQAHAFKWIIYILSFALFAFVIQFFRNPSVSVAANDKLVLSPADGKVESIEEVTEAEFTKAKSIRISIRLSPLNARVTRNPISGVVKYFKFQPKSGTEREYTTVAIQNGSGATVVVQQTSGAPIENLVSTVKQDDAVTQGQPFGFVKFGNHVAIFLPAGTKIHVEPGEAVQAGVAVLATLKP